jgi:hypothetical protein
VLFSDYGLPLILYLGKNALPDVKNDLNYFIKNGKGKKMVFDEVRRLRRCV